MYFLIIILFVPVLIFAQDNNGRVRVSSARNDEFVNSAPFTINRGRIRVATLANTYPPFASVRSDCVDADPSEKECRGIKRYEGYCIQLMDALREHLPGKPQYDFDVSQTDFNGILGQLQRREVDISCGPLVSNQDRTSQAVEFSQPFANTSISIMMKRPDDSCFTTLFRPFTWPIWLFIFLTFFFLLLARFLLTLLKNKIRNAQPPANQIKVDNTYGNSAGPYTSPHTGFQTTTYTGPHNQSHPFAEEKNYDFYNQQQKKFGFVKNIRRLLKYFLWGFTMFLLAYYFANLTAHFIQRQTQRNQIRNIKNLVEQSRVQYGFVRNGPTHQFLMNSPDPVHQQILRNAQSQSPFGFVYNYSEGVQQVRNSNGDFAFLLEDTANQHAMQDECTTFTAGHFGSLNYGFAMPAESPWRPQIDVALQKLQEDEELESMRSNWWPTSSCPTEEDSHRLGWSDLWCFFMLLLIFLLLGLLYILVKHFKNLKSVRGQVTNNKRSNNKQKYSEGKKKSFSVRNEATSTDESYDNQHTQLHPAGGTYNSGAPGDRTIIHPIRVLERR